MEVTNNSQQTFNLGLYCKGQPWKSIFLSNFRLIFRSIPKAAETCLAVVEKFDMLCKHEGLNNAVKYSKEVERYVRMTFLDQSPNFSQFTWTKLDSRGLPSFLKIDHSLIAEPEYQRAVLTALGYYKLYSLSPDESVINRITEGGSKTLCPKLLDEIESFSENFFKEKGITPFKPVDTLPIYATTKAGASGHSAMGMASIADARSVVDLSIKEKIDKVLPQCYVEKRVTMFQDIFERSLLQFKYTFKYRPALSRIHLLSEGGGKTRAICIPDIWTQSVLKPVHEYLMNILRSMPNDGTFSHPAIAEKVRRVTNHHSLYCYDLVAATDRFPLEVQKRVLKPLLGPLVEGWSNLISDRDFRYKKQLIRYGVGQPMGMLSSWPAFTLSHHIIINMCKNDKSFYAVIGDDMVLQSQQAAKRYRSMMDSLGVLISDEKSLEPKGKSKVGEIAKRYFRNGLDISPIPPKVLIESTKSLEGFVEFREVLASRTGQSNGTLPGLDWSETLSTLWKHNKDYGSETAQALLTCPTFLLSITGTERKLAPLSGLTSLWDISKAPLIKMFWERFLTEESVNRINTIPIAIKGSMGGNARPGPTEIGQTPIINEYLSFIRERLLKIVRIYSGLYVDSEADSFEPSPEKVLVELISNPDPYSPKDFQEKRRVRRKRNLELIQKFWTKHKGMISPPVPNSAD